MKNYKYLIFDADHTLLDYAADEKVAFAALYTELGVPVTEELLQFSRHASETAWSEAGLYDVHREDIQQAYHVLYRTHVKGIFSMVNEKYGFTLDSVSAGERFIELLARKGKLLPFAEEILRQFSENEGGRYGIIIATNGLEQIQRVRLTPLLKYVKSTFISENVGAIKPLSTFFEAILQNFGAKAEECLMIGDSLSSDMAGAKGVGMDCCWVNWHGQKNTLAFQPNYEVKTLKELQDIL